MLLRRALWIRECRSKEFFILFHPRRGRGEERAWRGGGERDRDRDRYRDRNRDRET